MGFRAQTSAADILDRLAVVDPPPGLLGAQRSLRLRRAWPHRDDHLSLEYATPDGERVAGQWFGIGGAADRSRLDTVARRTARGVPGTHRAGIAVVDPGVLLQAGGVDRTLRCLPTLAARAGAVLVVHRPERRAVVRLDAPSGARYVKVVRPDRVRGLVDRARVASAAAAGGEVAVAQLLGHVRDDGVTVWSELPGRSLCELVRDEPDPGTVAHAAAAAGRAVAALHHAPVGDRRLPAHTALHETDVVATWVRRAAAYVPGRASHLDAAAAVARRLLTRSPGSVSGLVHRDCYDKQLLIGGRVGLVDLDTLAVGDPALDVANALVHFQLRALQGQANAAAAAAGFVDGYGPVGPVRQRIAAYAAATRARLACVYSFRPGSAHVVDGLLADVCAPLPGLDR